MFLIVIVLLIASVLFLAVSIVQSDWRQKNVVAIGLTFLALAILVDYLSRH